MNITAKLTPILKRLTDWFLSLLVIALTLCIAIIWWDRYNGVSGFIRDFWGILATPMPVPFWILVLLGVGLSITVYRKRERLKKLIELDE